MNDFIASTISQLEKELGEANADLSKIQLLFAKHVSSNFLKYFIKNEISRFSNDESFSPVGLINKAGIHFINNDNFEYSIRLCGDFSINDNLKWMGMSQL